MNIYYLFSEQASVSSDSYLPRWEQILKYGYTAGRDV